MQSLQLANEFRNLWRELRTNEFVTDSGVQGASLDIGRKVKDQRRNSGHQGIDQCEVLGSVEKRTRQRGGDAHPEKGIKGRSGDGIGLFKPRRDDDAHDLFCALAYFLGEKRNIVMLRIFDYIEERDTVKLRLDGA